MLHHKWGPNAADHRRGRHAYWNNRKEKDEKAAALQAEWEGLNDSVLGKMRRCWEITKQLLAEWTNGWLSGGSKYFSNEYEERQIREKWERDDRYRREVTNNKLIRDFMKTRKRMNEMDRETRIAWEEGDKMIQHLMEKYERDHPAK